MTNPLQVLLSALLAISLTGCGQQAKQEVETATPAAVSEVQNTASVDTPVYGMWFSYVEYRDLCSDMDGTAFSAFADQAVSQMKDLGINTLYVHASAFTDAFYNSSIYPRTAVLKHTDYDPLAVFVEKAHAAGMHIEAWINPMRSVTYAEADSLPDGFIIKKWIKENNERCRPVEGRYYLNPAYPEVRDLIVSVVNEILDHYQVDGIHMDDYFYPAGAENAFDAYIYSKAVEENPDLTLTQFRTSNVNELVKEIYEAVKRKNSSLLFGISPSGNLSNDLNVMYADPSAWVSQKTIDYLEPQIYWGFEHPTAPFEATLDSWLQITAGSKTALIPGLAAYKAGKEDQYAGDASDEWEEHDDMLARETALAMQKGCSGAAYFSYESLFHPENNVRNIVDNEILHIKDVINPS